MMSSWYEQPSKNRYISEHNHFKNPSYWESESLTKFTMKWEWKKESLSNSRVQSHFIKWYFMFYHEEVGIYSYLNTFKRPIYLLQKPLVLSFSLLSRIFGREVTNSLPSTFLYPRSLLLMVDCQIKSWAGSELGDVLFGCINFNHHMGLSSRP